MICLFSTPELDRVKIGYSSKPEKRLIALKTGTPLFLSAAYPGGYEEKENLKVKFSQYQVRHPNMTGDWYTNSWDIRVHFNKRNVIPVDATTEQVTAIFAEYARQEAKEKKRRFADLENRLNIVTKSGPVLEYRLVRDIALLRLDHEFVFEVMSRIGMREIWVDDLNLGTFRLFASGAPNNRRKYPASMNISIGRHSLDIDLGSCTWSKLTQKLRVGS